jgi:hypothetical protein
VAWRPVLVRRMVDNDPRFAVDAERAEPKNRKPTAIPWSSRVLRASLQTASMIQVKGESTARICRCQGLKPDFLVLLGKFGYFI